MLRHSEKFFVLRWAILNLVEDAGRQEVQHASSTRDAGAIAPMEDDTWRLAPTYQQSADRTHQRPPDQVKGVADVLTEGQLTPWGPTRLVAAVCTGAPPMKSGLVSHSLVGVDGVEEAHRAEAQLVSWPGPIDVDEPPARSGAASATARARSCSAPATACGSARRTRAPARAKSSGGRSIGTRTRRRGTSSASSRPMARLEFWRRTRRTASARTWTMAGPGRAGEARHDAPRQRERGPAAHQAAARSEATRSARGCGRPPVPRPIPCEVPVLRQRLGQAPPDREAVLLGETLLRASSDDASSPDDASGPVSARDPSQHAVQTRSGMITRNVANLVVVPTPKYKRGKGLTVPEVRTLLKEARASRLHALRRGRDPRPCAAGSCCGCASRTSTRGAHGGHRTDRAAGPR